MTMLPSGKAVCDRDGTDVGNGGIDLCVIVSDVDPDNRGMVLNLHFCRENGCDKKVLSARNLEHFRTKIKKEK
jgi:hypothetical protein